MNFKRIIIFVGLPGSGKGTLSKQCVEQLGWKQLSTGDVCRKHIAEQTEIGKKIDFAIKSGKLVSDSVISQMVFDWLRVSFESTDVVIFDGYPRTVAQAQGLHDFINKDFKQYNCKLQVVKLVVPIQVVRSRMADRIICSNKKCQAVYSTNKDSAFSPKNDLVCDKCECALTKRPDDCSDSIDVRLETYVKHENELLNFFDTNGYSVVDIAADSAIYEVFDRLKQELGA